jgi:hypothetical protein
LRKGISTNIGEWQRHLYSELLDQARHVQARAFGPIVLSAGLPKDPCGVTLSALTCSRIAPRAADAPVRRWHNRKSATSLGLQVDVGMVAVSAHDAAEDRLAFAAPEIDDTARRASLRGVGRIDGHHPSATFLDFVGEFLDIAELAFQIDSTNAAGPSSSDRRDLPSARTGHAIFTAGLPKFRWTAARLRVGRS